MSYKAQISIGKAFHQVGARSEKTLDLVEASQILLRLGVISVFLFRDYGELGRVCQERQSRRYVGPRSCRALMVKTSKLNLILSVFSLEPAKVMKYWLAVGSNRSSCENTCCCILDPLKLMDQSQE